MTTDPTQLSDRARKERWAPVLDGWLGAHHGFRAASEGERERGIDRVAAGADGRAIEIEYRCDDRAHRSGHVFMEALPKDAGFALASEAEWVFYLIAPRKVLVFRAARLASALSQWARRCRIRPGAGGAVGLVVPTPIAELAAERVVRLDQPDAGGAPFLSEERAP